MSSPVLLIPLTSEEGKDFLPPAVQTSWTHSRSAKSLYPYPSLIQHHGSRFSKNINPKPSFALGVAPRFPQTYPWANLASSAMSRISPVA